MAYVEFTQLDQQARGIIISKITDFPKKSQFSKNYLIFDLPIKFIGRNLCIYDRVIGQF